MDDTKHKVKVVKGPKAAVATFIRTADKVRIYVFKRPRESVDNAISRVKKRNGSVDSEHQLIQ